MIDDSQLIKRISGLPSDELLRIIYAEPSEYRFEARAYAKAELQKRGVAVDKSGIERVTRAARAESAPEVPYTVLAKLTSRSATFTIGFIGGLSLFVIANYRAVEYSVYIHGEVYAGWPFRFSIFGGLASISIIDLLLNILPVLLLDILIASIICIGGGFIFTGIIGFLKNGLAESRDVR
jgi:hypothetical protein